MLKEQILKISPNKKQQNRAIDDAIKKEKNYRDILVEVYRQGVLNGRSDALEIVTKYSTKVEPSTTNAYICTACEEQCKLEKETSITPSQCPQLKAFFDGWCRKEDKD